MDAAKLWNSARSLVTTDKKERKAPDLNHTPNAGAPGSLEAIPKNLLNDKKLRHTFFLELNYVFHECDDIEKNHKHLEMSPHEKRSTLVALAQTRVEDCKDGKILTGLEHHQKQTFILFFEELIKARFEFDELAKKNPHNLKIEVPLQGHPQDRFSLCLVYKQKDGKNIITLTYSEKNEPARRTLMSLGEFGAVWEKPALQDQLPPPSRNVPLPETQGSVPGDQAFASQSARFGLPSSRPPVPVQQKQEQELASPVRFQGELITPSNQHSGPAPLIAPHPRSHHVPHWVDANAFSPRNTDSQLPVVSEKVVSDPSVTKDSSPAVKEAENKRLTQWLLQRTYDESKSPDENFTSYLVNTRQLYNGDQTLVFRDGEIRLPDGRRMALREVPAGLRMENFTYAIKGVLIYHNGSVTTSTDGAKLMPTGPDASGRAYGSGTEASASSGATAEAGRGGKATGGLGSTLVRLDTQPGTTLIATGAGVTIVDKESGRSYITKGPLTLQFGDSLPINE